MTQKDDNKLLAEFAGFKKTKLESGNMGWSYPPGYIVERGYLPNLRHDLNAQVKWLVPKLGSIVLLIDSLGAFAKVSPKLSGLFFTARVSDPAEALHEAILKLVKEMKGESSNLPSM